MFSKLRNKIVIITMVITTAVLLIAGGSIMFFSSTIRPEPKQRFGVTITEINGSESIASEFVPEIENQDLREFIRSDRRDGSMRLFFTLLSVGIAIEIIVFLISYYLSERIVAPVEDAYDKQKLFIANASHELKTPLAVIQANMEALEVDKENEVWKNNIEIEITHANKLVLDLLQLAKMDAGGVDKGTIEKVDMDATISEQIEIFRPRFSGEILYRKTSNNTERELSKQDFLQILTILLDNATKYGKKKIKVELNNDKIIVANDGATVKKEDLEKIFDRFYQTDKTREGSGLGLAIAKAVCEKNGWKISCESDKRTTKFIVAL